MITPSTGRDGSDAVRAFRAFQLKWIELRFESAAISFRSSLTAKAGFDPNQPRVPAGNPDGGQWTDGAGGGGSGGGGGGGWRGNESTVSDSNPIRRESRKEKLRRIEGERKKTIRQTILTGKIKGGFHLDPNPDANGAAPWYELGQMSTVKKYKADIEAASMETGVDANLIRAVMYVETTHGYYDPLVGIIDKNKSILPMNMNIESWDNLFGDRDQLNDPKFNILAGAKLLNAIERNFLIKPSIAEIASLYNTLRTTIITNYGARVERVYRNKTWELF